MNTSRKIVVLTPVKNEAWILNSFLSVCSTFADHILIADQQSTDGSLDIYPNFPKVTLVKNENPDFNEAERQLLLLNKARELYGENTILLALDADELIAANATKTEDWQRMLNTDPGTVLYFEKPSLYRDSATVIRFFHGGWPLGYVDDGATHFPDKIHSTRVPTPPNAPKVYLEQIKFIHYNTLRLDANASKLRYYGMLENIHNTKGLRNRIRMYNSNIEASQIGDAVETTKKEWLDPWKQLDIEVHNFPTFDHYWYDIEALRLMKKYGTKRFAFDDIWNYDWESLRQKALKREEKNIPLNEIKRPFGVLSHMIEKVIRKFDNTVLLVKNSLAS